MLIDTHCHLDAESFDADREAVLSAARTLGYTDALICTGFAEGFGKATDIAREFGLHYALGAHPLCIDRIDDEVRFLSLLEHQVSDRLDDPAFAAIGEIGLDGYVTDLPWEKQLRLFRAQLKLARRLGLPVSVHARHALDAVAKAIREIGCVGGVVHAFNGSWEQAQRLIGLGLKLGFGGAMTYSGSLRIRRVFSELGEHDYVLETDAPDMPSSNRRNRGSLRTEPADLVEYVEIAAQLRHTDTTTILSQSSQNAIDAFPRFGTTVSS